MQGSVVNILGSKVTDALSIEPKHKVWNLETSFLGLAGLSIMSSSFYLHLGVVAETIALVILLGGLIGITRIPFPQTIAGKPVPVWGFPLLSGFFSSFMDSFLVLLLIKNMKLEGEAGHIFRFKAYNMLAALIGGLMLYFGEVYMLPLALKYNMRDWHSMIPIIPPVLVFLLFLAWQSKDLKIAVKGMKDSGTSDNKKSEANPFDYIEFFGFIILLLAIHNVLLCLGLLLLYASVTGQGEDLLEVIKNETEVGVMLLLICAVFAGDILAPIIGNFSGWWAFIPATINGVITGALYPAQGNVWIEVCILSTAVLITPVSSLVGVMLFDRLSSWFRYMKVSIPFALIWFVIVFGWFSYVWPPIEDNFYSFFSRPELVSDSVPH